MLGVVGVPSGRSRPVIVGCRRVVGTSVVEGGASGSGTAGVPAGTAVGGNRTFTRIGGAVNDVIRGGRVEP